MTPDDLQKHLDVIARYLEEPIDLGGKAPSQFIQKKRGVRRPARRSRRSGTSSESENEAQSSDGELVPKKRIKKRQKEDVFYKSAEFIDDSDIDPEADAAFMAKEEAIRQRAEAAAEAGQSTLMQATGTKKRKRGKNESVALAEQDPASALQKQNKADDREQDSERAAVSKSAKATTSTSRARTSRKRAKPSRRGSAGATQDSSDREIADLPSPIASSSNPSSAVNSPKHVEVPRARPRPRPRYAPSSPAATTSPASSPAPGTQFGGSSSAGSDNDDDAEVIIALGSTPGVLSDEDDTEVKLSYPRPPARRRALVLSDDEE